MLSRLFALLVFCVPLAAQSQYPSQTVRVVVGFPPGGGTDVIGRLVAQGLAERLGKAFVGATSPRSA